MKLFQCAAILRATEKEKEDGSQDKIIVEVQTFLAKDQNAAVLRVARSIPEVYSEKLDQVEIAVRPF